MGKAFIGTSGFYYANWIGAFYPSQIKKESLLGYYQRYFNTVEINSSFYHIPRASTVENWKMKVMSDFIFVFKASRTVTHLKKFNVDEALINLVFNPLKEFESKPAKHIILFQTPSNVKANPDKLYNLLSLLPNTFLYAFEFRHDTWFSEEIYSVLRKFNAATVISDSPRQTGERMWPYYDVDTADFAYVRFHGSEKLYYSSYTEDELKYYAELIKRKMKRKMNVYAYFNNDAGGYATKNALRLKELLNNS